jgi:DEAD/DEAH box helicase domain-containing protein
MTVFGYFKLDAQTGQVIEDVELHMDPVKFTRFGFWIDLPTQLVQSLEQANIDVEAAVHAATHIMLQVIPTCVLSSENDLQTECKHPSAKRFRTPRSIRLCYMMCSCANETMIGLCFIN